MTPPRRNPLRKFRRHTVRAGRTPLVDERRRVALGRAISDGYRRIPQADDDLERADAASAAMVAEEPW